MHLSRTLILALLLLVPTSTWAAHNCNDAGSIATKTCTTDGTYADTQDAINDVIARNEQDWVITVGSAAGSYSWATQLTITSPNRLTVQGASSGSGYSAATKLDWEGNPVGARTSGLTEIALTSGDAFGIVVNGSDGDTVTLKNFEFSTATNTIAMIFIGGAGDNVFRVTNCVIGSITCPQSIWVGAPQSRDIITTPTVPAELGPYGVFDHLTVTNDHTLVFVRDYDCVRSWMTPMSWATRKKVVIEDSYFSGGGGACDGDTGSRICVRNNDGLNWQVTNHGSEGDPTATVGNPGYHPAHGLDSSLQLEVNDNIFTSNSSAGAWMSNGEIFIRGGAARIWNNVVNRPDGANIPAMIFIKATYYRDTMEGAGNGVTVTDRTTTMGPTSRASTEYLGTQQPGMGVVDWDTYSGPSDPVTNDGPGGVLDFTDHDQYPWGLVGIWAWSNTLPAISFPVAVYGSFVRDPDEATLTSGTGARPADFAEYDYPHELQGGVAPTPTPAPLFKRGMKPFSRKKR